MIVAEILLRALVFRFANNVARELRLVSAGGEPALSVSREPEKDPVRGGRWETQSWTSSETLGFEIRLCVLREEGLVVIIIVG